MSKKVVEFFYDVASPYSWFAFEVICRYQHIWHIDLKLRPFLLGAVFKGSDNFVAPPKIKTAYSRIDVPRLGKHFTVPITHPKDLRALLFTKGTLNAQRFLTAVDMNQPQMLENVTRELWMRAWSRDEDIYEPESFAQAARKVGMSETANILSKLKDDAVKQLLRKRTQDALDMGAFGSPIIATEINGKKEWVWGSDRFHIFADMIGEKWEGPLPDTSNKL